ncbi:MAG: hypothetical protein Q8O00_02720, partial [Holophaga sp.]|nr:hypothetical protein [Holophaga sp.]
IGRRIPPSGISAAPAADRIFGQKSAPKKAGFWPKIRQWRPLGVSTAAAFLGEGAQRRLAPWW